MPAKTPTPGQSVTVPNLAPAAEPAKPLRWVQDLFKRKLRLERQGVQIHVRLDPPPPASPLPEAPEAAELRRRQTLRQARTELHTLLDRHADTRHVVPHLSYLEQMLARSGLRAIGRLPLPVLHKALTQLESLIHDEPGEGLAELRRRMAAVIAVRLGGTPGQAPANPQLMSDFHTEDRLEVSEGSHSQFDELERSWTGTVPEAVAALAPTGG
jgi:hypothetical protein